MTAPKCGIRDDDQRPFAHSQYVSFRTVFTCSYLLQDEEGFVEGKRSSVDESCPEKLHT